MMEIPECYFPHNIIPVKYSLFFPSIFFCIDWRNANEQEPKTFFGVTFFSRTIDLKRSYTQVGGFALLTGNIFYYFQYDMFL